MSAVSRPAWMLALSGAGDRIGAPRRSPVEIVATMGVVPDPHASRRDWSRALLAAVASTPVRSA